MQKYIRNVLLCTIAMRKLGTLLLSFWLGERVKGSPFFIFIGGSRVTGSPIFYLLSLAESCTTYLEWPF